MKIWYFKIGNIYSFIYIYMLLNEWYFHINWCFCSKIDIVSFCYIFCLKISNSSNSSSLPHSMQNRPSPPLFHCKIPVLKQLFLIVLTTCQLNSIQKQDRDLRKQLKLLQNWAQNRYSNKDLYNVSKNVQSVAEVMPSCIGIIEPSCI